MFMGGCGRAVRTSNPLAVKTDDGWEHGICHDLDEADHKYNGLVNEVRLAGMIAGHRDLGGL